MTDREFGRLSRELDAVFELSDRARSERLATLRGEAPAFDDAGMAALQSLSPTGLASEHSHAAEAAALALAALGRKHGALARLDAILPRRAEVFGEQHAQTRATRALRAGIARR